MKGALSIGGCNTTGSTHRSLLLFLVMLPAILCLAGPVRADGWERVIPSGAVPAARAGHSMVLLGGKVYMFGGEGNSGGSGGERATAGILLSDLWSFAVESNEWQLVSPHPPLKPRKNHAAVAYGEKMYIFFGDGGQGVPLGDIWAYDSVSNLWQEVITQGTGPTARSGHDGVVTGDTYYLFGGKDKYNNVYSDLYSFNFGTKAWKQETESDYASQGHKTLTDGDQMYVYGGDNGQLVYNHLLAYGFATQAWRKIDPQSTIPTGRTDHIATLAGNKITASGGKSQTEELKDTWEYDIVSNQ